ncbi:mitochondrial intermediate peptidase [Rhincodon typus]|uniref:mitochondrial intermediate peptidase n=1 Tax=Rhincodon typus TaxID=259920 RepID=UPI00202EA031|nr:mitochondrial intermediate peptidase [Rhincodon typus]
MLNRQWLTFFKCIQTGRFKTYRNVSTSWSPVGAAFNDQLRRKVDIFGKNVGLFGVHELNSPVGFQVAQENALNEMEQLVEQACRTPPGPQVVQIFDRLSDCLCRIADLVSSDNVLAPPDLSYISQLHNPAGLNTNIELCNSLKNLLNDKEAIDSLDPDTRRVAELFMFDFEISGIHLNKEKRKKVVNLNVQMLDLNNSFLLGTQLPNKIDRSAIPEHIQHYFSIQKDYIHVNSLHADAPDDLVSCLWTCPKL